jgi:hypothetical protein
MFLMVLKMRVIIAFSKINFRSRMRISPGVNFFAKEPGLSAASFPLVALRAK